MAGCTGQRHIAPLMRLPRASIACAALAALAACDLSVEPPAPIPPVDVSIDFCSDDVPVWVGYQQLGQNWVRLTPDAENTVSFSAEYRVAFATVHQNGADTRTEVLYTTSNVLASISGRLCREESGNKALNGSVTGFSGSQRALVSMGVSSVYRIPGQNTFTLANLPTRPLDIMASRMTFVGDAEQHASRTILRRSQNLVGNISQLDFDAAEAFTPTTANIAVTALSPEDDAYVLNNFFSQLETTHLLTYVEGITNGNITVEAIPSSSTAAGEYHEAIVTAISPAGHARGAERFFRTAASHAIAVGPELLPPVMSTITTTPYVRIRTQLPGQPAYPSAVMAEFDQELSFSANKFILTITAGYFGTTVFNWDIPMDDMSGAPGWQNSWGLQNGEHSWTVTAFGARADLLLGAPPAQDELAQFAIRFSDPPSQMRRFSRPPRPFGSLVRRLR